MYNNILSIIILSVLRIISALNLLRNTLRIYRIGLGSVLQPSALRAGTNRFDLGVFSSVTKRSAGEVGIGTLRGLGEGVAGIWGMPRGRLELWLWIKLGLEQIVCVAVLVGV